MKTASFSRFIIFLCLVLAACAVKPPQTPTLTPTSLAPEPTPTSTPDPGIITPETVNQLVQIKQFGMGEAAGSPLYSPDGKWLFQATTTGVFVFDTGSYANSRLLIPFTNMFNQDGVISLSPDGKTLVFGENLFMVEGGQKLPDLESPPNLKWYSHPITRKAKFSPDGSLIARNYSVEPSGAVSRVGVWSLTEGKLLHIFEATSLLYSFEFSLDGSLLCIQSGDENEKAIIDLYDLQTGKKLRSWTGGGYAFLSENRLLVGTDGVIRIFDLKTGTGSHAFLGKFEAISPDEQIVILLNSGQFKIYRISDEQLLGTLAGDFTGVDITTLRFSSNGKSLAGFTSNLSCCLGHNDDFSLWRVSDGTLIKKVEKPSSFFNFSPDGKSLAITVGDSSTQIINTSDGSLLANIGAYNLDATGVAFSPDGRQLVVAGLEDTTNNGAGYKSPLFFYDIESGELIKHESAMERNQKPVASTDKQIYTSGNHVMSEGCCAAFSPDGKKAAGRSRDGFNIVELSDEGKRATIRDHSGYDIVDPSKNKLILSVSTSSKPVTSLSFSPDGQRLAVAFDVDAFGNSYPIEVWEAIPDGKMIMRIDPVDYKVTMVDYSPDGRFIAAGGFFYGVVLWNASDGSLRFKIKARVLNFEPLGAQGVSRLAFSPDGRILAIGSDFIEFWDTEKGEKIYSLDQQGTTYNLSFSPDGRFLAAAFAGGAARIFGIK